MIMYIGTHQFDLEHNSYVMGILNITPDSFSDGGSYMSMDAALKQAERMVEEGASILDIGGESTRPGYRKVSDQEEMDRVLPVIERLRREIDVPLSLDTYKASVAREGIAAGVDMINDIWGLKYDPGMASLLAEKHVACCLMHNRKHPCEKNFLEEFCRDVDEILAIADKAGISRDRILLDPGVGFGKDYSHNLLILRNLEIMKCWNLPVLLGTSRKSVIGLTLQTPVTEREEGTIATTVLGRLKGASVFRVHDVKGNIRALKMTDAILETQRRIK